MFEVDDDLIENLLIAKLITKFNMISKIYHYSQSPNSSVDIKENSLWKWCKEFTSHNINLLFDPQCYYPKQNHKNLSMYGYHNLVNYTNIGKKDNVTKEEQLLIKIKEYNDIANTIEYIVPSIMQSEIDNDWFIKNKLLVDK